jgi:hypothetical protein
LGRLSKRLDKMEKHREGPGILEVSLQESGLTAPEWHWHRALARATPDELAELERCRTAVQEARLGRDTDEAGSLHDPKELAWLEVQEAIMRREAPTLADDIRCRRDALYRVLRRLREEWREQGRDRSTSYSDPAYWNVDGAVANRRNALLRGGRLVEEEEAGRIVEQIIELDAEPHVAHAEVLTLVGWR